MAESGGNGQGLLTGEIELRSLEDIRAQWNPSVARLAPSASPAAVDRGTLRTESTGNGWES